MQTPKQDIPFLDSTSAGSAEAFIRALLALARHVAEKRARDGRILAVPVPDQQKAG